MDEKLKLLSEINDLLESAKRDLKKEPEYAKHFINKAQEKLAKVHGDLVTEKDGK